MTGLNKNIIHLKLSLFTFSLTTAISISFSITITITIVSTIILWMAFHYIIFWIITVSNYYLPAVISFILCVGNLMCCVIQIWSWPIDHNFISRIKII